MIATRYLLQIFYQLTFHVVRLVGLLHLVDRDTRYVRIRDTQET